ncbi:MAG TPA: hypothetical protein VFL85_04435 [Candidatus Saccharimonadales bacterium]|nr:hypothetical protein [Candidatus Saccharimonadales bacterium]
MSRQGKEYIFIDKSYPAEEIAAMSREDRIYHEFRVRRGAEIIGGPVIRLATHEEMDKYREAAPDIYANRLALIEKNLIKEGKITPQADQASGELADAAPSSAAEHEAVAAAIEASRDESDRILANQY